MKSNSPPPASWPPVIEFARAPWFVRVRDILLTLAAWAAPALSQPVGRSARPLALRGLRLPRDA